MREGRARDRRRSDALRQQRWSRALLRELRARASRRRPSEPVATARGPRARRADSRAHCVDSRATSAPSARCPRGYARIELGTRAACDDSLFSCSSRRALRAGHARWSGGLLVLEVEHLLPSAPGVVELAELACAPSSAARAASPARELAAIEEQMARSEPGELALADSRCLRSCCGARARRSPLERDAGDASSSRLGPRAACARKTARSRRCSGRGGLRSLRACAAGRTRDAVLAGLSSARRSSSDRRRRPPGTLRTATGTSTQSSARADAVSPAMRAAARLPAHPLRGGVDDEIFAARGRALRARPEGRLSRAPRWRNRS